jgi:hypothetical protein
MSRSIAMEKQISGAPLLGAFLLYFFLQAKQNIQVEMVVHRLSLWDKSVMHNYMNV